MKKNIAIVSALLALLVCGCDLNLYPEDSVTPNNYFKTATDFELWCNAMYTMLPAANSSVGLNADDVIDNSPQALVNGSRSALTETWSWEQLRNINYMLEHADQCDDENVRNRWIAEARFFRAYFYFAKVRTYGDVPYYTAVIESSDFDRLQQPRDDRAFVMYKVMEDFDFAAQYLPAKAGYARVNKWSALAMKSRAALYEGTFRKYHALADVNVENVSVGATWFLEQAADAAQQVMKSGLYGLEQGSTAYRDMFVAEDASDSEFILARIYSSINTNDVRANSKNEHQAFTRRFMNHYLLKNGNRITSVAGYESLPFAQEVKNRDPRLAQTVQTSESRMYGSSVAWLNGVTGYQPVKFESTADKNSSGKGTLDFPIIRYAEVLLNYAEAKAELGTITQEDVNASVALVRARAGVEGGISLEDANASCDELLASYYPNVDQGANKGIILEIRRERTVELVMEGLRQWDMLRWREGAQIVNHDNPYLGVWIDTIGSIDFDEDGKADFEIYKNSPESSLSAKYKLGQDINLSEGDHGYIVAYKDVDYVWEENRDYLWPIPAKQRVLNNNLTQNPNWPDGLNF